MPEVDAEQVRRRSLARRRVARGARWLDQREPHWEKLIDLDTLRMADGCRCVLAQTADRLIVNLDRSWEYDDESGVNPYTQVVEHLLGGVQGYRRAELLGFDEEDVIAPASDGYFVRSAVAFEDLQEAWVEEIVRRRANDAA